MDAGKEEEGEAQGELQVDAGKEEEEGEAQGELQVDAGKEEEEGEAQGELQTPVDSTWPEHLHVRSLQRSSCILRHAQPALVQYDSHQS